MIARHNCVIWDHICSEGIDALNELENEQWIESYEINPIEFLKGIGFSSIPLANLPFAEPGVLKDSYQAPHWLLIKFESGLKLITIKLLNTCCVQEFHNPSENDLLRKTDFLEIDKFANSEEINDERQRVLQLIVQRQGQPQFRTNLLEAYEGMCAITGCDFKEALEAAHIIPYLGSETNHLSNGLILCADLHTLFDLFLFTIDSESLMVIISPSLKNTCYEKLDGKNIRQRKKGYPDISKGALHYHLNQCQWLRN